MSCAKIEVTLHQQSTWSDAAKLLIQTISGLRFRLPRRSSASFRQLVLAFTLSVVFWGAFLKGSSFKMFDFDKDVFKILVFPFRFLLGSLLATSDHPGPLASLWGPHRTFVAPFRKPVGTPGSILRTGRPPVGVVRIL